MRISEILTPEEIRLVKVLCKIFAAQWVEIDGVRYQPPKG